MSEWYELTLGDAINVKHGYAFPGDGFGADSSGPQVLTPANFSLSGGFQYAKPKSFAGEYPSDFLLESREYVTTMTDLSKAGDTLGFVTRLPHGEKFLHNQRIGLVQLKDPTKLDLRFLTYLSRTQVYRSHILGTASGSTVKHTSPGRIGTCVIHVPPLPEQQAIAEVLGALDDKIAANVCLSETVDSYLACMFEQIVAYTPEVAALGEIADVNRVSVKPVDGGQLRYIDIASVGVGTFDYPDFMSWSEAPGRARRSVRRGDTMWSTVRPNRRSHALNLSSDPALVASTGLAVISPKSVGFAYLYEATKRPEFTTYLENVAEGSAYPAVRAERFLAAPIPAVPAQKIDGFEMIAAPLREAAFAATTENRTLAATRDALLPQLMSGKLRVREAERFASEAGA